MFLSPIIISLIDI